MSRSKIPPDAAQPPKHINAPIRWRFAQDNVTRDEIEKVVAELDAKLRKPVPKRHSEVVGRSLLNATLAVSAIDSSLRHHGAPAARAKNKKQQHAAELAAGLLEKLVDSDIRAGCVEELLQQRLELLSGSRRLPANSLARLEEIAHLKELRRSMAADLKVYFAGLVDAVVELNNLLEGIPAVRGARKKDPPITNWRQAVTDELAQAYELIFERAPDQGQDWIALVKFAHERADVACEDELARTFSPAWQVARRSSAE